MSTINSIPYEGTPMFSSTAEKSTKDLPTKSDQAMMKKKKTRYGTLAAVFSGLALTAILGYHYSAANDGGGIRASTSLFSMEAEMASLDLAKTSQDNKRTGLVCTNNGGTTPMRTPDGKPCASMTTYDDRTKGACAEMKENGNAFSAPSKVSLTAALNTVNLNPEDPEHSYCPLKECGSCYKLTNVGNEDDYHIFKVTNRCGDGYPDRLDVCNQKITAKKCDEDVTACLSDKLNLNKGGYSAHFDLQDIVSQINDTKLQAEGSLWFNYWEKRGRLGWHTTLGGGNGNPVIVIGTELAYEPVVCEGNWEEINPDDPDKGEGCPVKEKGFCLFYGSCKDATAPAEPGYCDVNPQTCISPEGCNRDGHAQWCSV